MTTNSDTALAITELSRRELRYLAKEHPEIASHWSGIVLAAADAELLRRALDLLETLSQLGERMERTIEVMMPPVVPGRAAVLQARRNAEAREALFREFGAFTSSEVADLAGSRAGNRAALANRWRKEGRIFGMTHQGQTWFASFQFGPDGRPLPVIAQVLSCLGDPDDGWQTALWFVSANGWLDGARPVDLLASAPAQVAEAARQETEELVF